MRWLALLLLLAAILWAVLWRALGRALPARHPNGGPDAAASGRLSGGELACAAAATLLALALRVPLMDRGFEYDEIWTALAFVETETLWETISGWHQFNNHVFYSLCARLSEALFGRSEWAVRLPALVFGVATVPAGWLAWRGRLGRGVALAAAFALATNSIHVGFSATARGYTGLALFALLSTTLFVRWVRGDGGTAALAAYVLAATLGVYTHLYGASVVVVHGLVLLLLAAATLRGTASSPIAADRFRKAWLALGAVAVLSLLCYAPVLYRLWWRLLTAEGSAFQPLLPLHTLTYLTGYAVVPTGLVLAATALGGLVAGLRRVRPEAETIGLLFLVPIGVTWLARPEFAYPRFFVFLMPFVALGVALGVVALWRALHERLPGHLAPVAAALVTAAVALGWASRPWTNVPRSGFRDAAAVLDAPTRRSGERVGMCAIGIGARFHEWYLRRPLFVPDSVEAFEDWAARHDEVRCAWIPHVAQLPAHDAVGRLLEEQAAAAPEGFLQIRVYRVRLGSDAQPAGSHGTE